ncbi:zinc ribbon domain-containing protein [Paenibacillus sp. LjRoot153]|uniref:zinc ribbon domain-containing protein n=1 Tax=Paenibacillus sp. LjRoot153 TaxID=3342270 RepID=UPI003F502A73
MFRSFLTYIANWYGRTISVVAKNYPSSQLCHVCGTHNPEVKKLGLRQWTCSNCCTVHDRDENASQNITSSMKD